MVWLWNQFVLNKYQIWKLSTNILISTEISNMKMIAPPSPMSNTNRHTHSLSLTSPLNHSHWEWTDRGYTHTCIHTHMYTYTHTHHSNFYTHVVMYTNNNKHSKNKDFASSAFSLSNTFFLNFCCCCFSHHHSLATLFLSCRGQVDNYLSTPKTKDVLYGSVDRSIHLPFEPAQQNGNLQSSRRS